MQFFDDDDLVNDFIFFEEFVATDVTCPNCGAIHNLSIEEGERDVRYRCSSCNKMYSVDWVNNSTRRVAE